MTRKTIFISDLHLDESEPAASRQFISLLQQCDDSVDALYILGDLFEVWIGDDDHSFFQKEIIEALKSATNRGLRVYFMYGNRDFLIGKKFLRKTGCQLISDEKRVELYNTPVLLMHGDTLCTNDIAYLKARKIGRNSFIQFMFLLLPLSFRRKIAANMRAKSAKHTQTVSHDIMDVTQAEVERVMQQHGVNYLIHGHTHRPDTHRFCIGGDQATRMVLGAWHENAHVLIWDESGACTVYRDIEKIL